VTNDAISIIAKILADGYVRLMRAKRDQPADASPVQAEVVPQLKAKPGRKPTRPRLADVTDFAPVVLTAPHTDRILPAELPPDACVALQSRLDSLTTMTARQLREEYRKVFGRAPATNHRQNLYRRIAWEIQAQAYGQRLSEPAQEYARKLAEGTELYRRVAEGLKKRRTEESAGSARVPPDDDQKRDPSSPSRDSRLPAPGSFLIRKHGSKLARVKVMESGFLYDGKAYKTLSAVARRITGKHWNGFLFFGLGKNPKTSQTKSDLPNDLK
jgi:hypothetical protein